MVEMCVFGADGRGETALAQFGHCKY